MKTSTRRGTPQRRMVTVTSCVLLSLILAWTTTPGQAQVALGLDLAPPIAPLNAVVVPDVNMLGILDQSGPNAGGWPKITKVNQKLALQRLGKAFFWDMQLGGDGVQACASCHFHAGGDNRKTNQTSPGFTLYANPDMVHDWVGPNETLLPRDFPLPTNELGLSGAGNMPDDPNGFVYPAEKLRDGSDVNDSVSSQGPRLGKFSGLTDPSADPLGFFGRVDRSELASTDPDGFNYSFSGNALGVPNTVRHVEPLNTPTVINAVYQLRNFWDGRADPFFNGRNPFGFRDPDARVPAWNGTTLVQDKLRVPFSSLASQSVGPPLSKREMHWDPRTFADLGKKMMRAKPLRGQEVAIDDSLLASLRDSTGGLMGTYGQMVRAIFDARFTGGTQDICLNADGSFHSGPVADGMCTSPYTLLEWNFPLIFGLAVQAYEATLFTERTIVDLLNGGVATGVVSNGLPGVRARSVNVGSPGPNPATGAPLPGLSLDACIRALTNGVRAADRQAGTDACYAHYAKFIHPGATTGSQMPIASVAVTGVTVEANQPIGGCVAPTTCAASPNLSNAIIAIDVIARGMGRFFAGATACGACHFNPELTIQTVAALTRFGAAPLPPLPPGQLRKLAPEVVMERMVAFNGAAAVYDAGFYNLGLRPSPEHLAIGDQIGGVPLSFAKLSEIINGGTIPVDLAGAALSGSPKDVKLNLTPITKIATELAAGNVVRIPRSPLDLTPTPFQLQLACGPGLNGQGGAAAEPNNNPNANCVMNVIPGERLLRNGAFHASGLRNVKFTGPYFHNGSKKNLRELLDFYKNVKHFETLNFNNLDAGLRVFDLGPADEAALIEFLETGLTDWRVAFEEEKFDHPQLCVPHGHHSTDGRTILVDIPAVGKAGAGSRLVTFEEVLEDLAGAHDLTAPCTMSIAPGGFSIIDVPVP